MSENVSLCVKFSEMCEKWLALVFIKLFGFDFRFKDLYLLAF